MAQYALVVRDRKILALWPNGENEIFWTLPGGRLNEDDNNYGEALQREVSEEIGQEINIIEPFYVDMCDVPNKGHRYAVFFLCSLKEKEKIKLSAEHHKYEWLDYDSLMSVVEKEPERGRPGIILLEKLREKELL